MIIVTGGAGFIGSNLVKALNDLGKSDILVVDNLTNAEKIANLSRLQIADFMDKDEFFDFIRAGTSARNQLDNVALVLHQGACSDTMESDGRYVMYNNYTFSKHLFHFCKERKAQYIYASSASVYGAGNVFKESPEFESTLNAYAYSKLMFDNYVRKQSDPGFQCVGLRFFNVYGPREQHKGRMASVAWHFRNQFLSEGKVRLFQGTDGYADGEQRRDFVSVDDVVKVNMFFVLHPDICGIYNVGTGHCQSFNDVAISVVNRLRAQQGQQSLTLEEAVSQGAIEYVPMPSALQGKYQSYTEADLDRLRESGYTDSFYTVEQGVERYMRYLENQSI
ncbi:MAG: ADP-glyceromanno-heptose 6-epimerase [bacterium]